MARYAIEMNGARRVVPLNFVLELVRRGDLDLQTRAWRDGAETTVAAICAEHERAVAARQAAETSTSAPGSAAPNVDGGWGAGAPSSPIAAPRVDVNAAPRVSTYPTQYDAMPPLPNAAPDGGGKGAAMKFVAMIGILAAILGAIVLVGVGLIPKGDESNADAPVATEETASPVVPTATDASASESEDEWDGDLDDPQDVLEDLRSLRDPADSGAATSDEATSEEASDGVEISGVEE